MTIIRGPDIVVSVGKLRKILVLESQAPSEQETPTSESAT